MSYLKTNTLSETTTYQLQQLINRNLDVVFPALSLAIIHRGEWKLDATWGRIDPERELVVACFTNRVYPGREKPGIDAFRRDTHDIIAEGFSS
jgi:hypothetical protein